MKHRKIVVLLSLCTLMSGCWDKIEIDRRSFISTIGIDPGKDIGKQNDLKSISPAEPFAERRIKKINVTYGFPDISKIEPGKGGTAEEKFISTEAYSMEDSISEATAKNSRTLLFGHSKLLLFSKDILEYPEVFKEILDFLQRDPSLNRNMLVAVAEGKAEDFTKFKPNTEKNVDAYLEGLMENSSRSAAILPVSLNEFLRLLSENGNAMLPRLTLEKDKKELTLAGVSIIKDYAIKGNLTPLETSDLEILRGKLKSGKRVIYMEGHPVDYLVDDISRDISFDYNEGKLHFFIDIQMEGSLKSYYTGKEVFNVKEIEKLQDNFNSSISEECEKVAKITQQKFMVDPIGLREYVEKYRPSVWKEVEKNWAETYKNAVIDVNVQTKIRRIGITR